MEWQTMCTIFILVGITSLSFIQKVKAVPFVTP